MMNKILIDVCPEFSYELALAVPFAYWAYKNNLLDKVVSSVDMKPFYYFDNNFEGKYTNRTIDNDTAGLVRIEKLYDANSWLHGAPGKPGILKYDKWLIPPYKEYYKNDEIKFDNPVIVISNQYNIERGCAPQRYFDIKCLGDMFHYFYKKGYIVIYKRPNNTEFILDQHEKSTISSNLQLTANLDGVGIINDYQLTEMFSNVILFNDLHKKYSHYTYNELQMKIFANAQGFISVSGGSAIVNCFFQKPSIIYASVSRETNIEYWSEEGYYQKISNNNCHPVIDIMKGKINNDYSLIFKYIEELFT